MKAIIKESNVIKGYPICYEFDTTEMFVDNSETEFTRAPEGKVFSIRCTSNPSGSYSTSVIFREGIFSQLVHFIKSTFSNEAEIIIGDSSFEISIIDDCPEDYLVNDGGVLNSTFRVAFAYASVEDAKYWCDINRYKERPVFLSNYH